MTVNFHERSTGNLVRLPDGHSWRGIVIDLGSAIECSVSLGAVRVQFGGLRISFVSNSGRCSTGAWVSVGDGCVFNGATHIIGPLTKGLGVHVGRDCLFASGISVRGSSHHGLWDLATGRLLNPGVGIEIGDHVWVGDQVVLLNKAKVSAGSVIAARSIVNKAFSEQNALLAGAPAAARRAGVRWTHAFPLDNGMAPLQE